MKPTRVIIMGAAGRDFHNFNCCFRNNPAFRVTAFTAAQIPYIAKRRYPAPWRVRSTRPASRSIQRKIWPN